MENVKQTKATVLLVDDVPMNLKILSAMLRKLGVEPVEVNDGPAALAYIEAHPVSVVLTDLWMLEMNGAELAEAVHRKRPELPVYAVTADAESMDNPMFQSKHLRKILIKPINLETLKSIVVSLQ